MRILFTCFIFILLLFSHNIQGVEIEKQLIEIIGESRSEMVLDTFIVKFKFIENGLVASKIKLLIDNKSQQFISTAISSGIKETEINHYPIEIHIFTTQKNKSTEGIEVNKKFINGDFGKVNLSIDEKGATDLNVELSKIVVIKFTHINEYQFILDSAIKLGVVDIFSATDVVNQRAVLYQQALEKALLNAKHKAERLAQLSGRKLGAILSIKEVDYDAAFNNEKIGATLDGFFDYGNKISVSAQVIVVFSLQH